MTRLVTGIILALAIGACSHGAGLAQKKQPPVVLTFALPDETSGMQQDTSVDLTVRATSELPQVKVDLRLPAEISLISGSLSWTGALRAGEERRLAQRIRVVRPGDFTLGASAEILEGPYQGQVAGAVLYIHATPAAVRWSRNPGAY